MLNLVRMFKKVKPSRILDYVERDPYSSRVASLSYYECSRYDVLRIDG